jgi:hypothetical protein
MGRKQDRRANERRIDQGASFALIQDFEGLFDEVVNVLVRYKVRLLRDQAVG